MIIFRRHLFCLLLMSTGCGYYSPDAQAQETPEERGPIVLKEWKSKSGAHYAFDGAFYSFANDKGQGVKFWVPPGDQPVRGAVLFGNPGGGLGGDTRSKSRQRDVVEFAARHRFGVGGVTGFPGASTYEELGSLVLEAFGEWGRHGEHPELEHVPFIFSGSSNAGVFSFAMMMRTPERTICITPNVGPYYKGHIDDKVRGVPAWMHIGTSDPLFAHGFEVTRALFDEHAPEGALWTWEAEMKGHENGASDHVDLAYWEALIPMRLPEGDMERGEAMTLNPIRTSAGWLTDFRTWDFDVAKVYEPGEFLPTPDTRKHYGWLPNEDIARLYQAAASRTRQLELSFVENRRAEGGAETGVLLSSSGSQLVDVGEPVTVRVDLKPLVRGIENIEIYDRARKIGEFDPRQSSDFTFTAEDQSVYALHARAHQSGRRGGKGVELVSNPLQVVVRNGQLTRQIDEQWEAVSWLRNYEARVQDPKERQGLLAAQNAPMPSSSVQSKPLSLAEIDGFELDGKISDFWEDFADDDAAALIDGACEVRGRAGGAKARVFSAYGEKGLYLLFRIDDPADSDEAGRIDFHIASVSPDTLRESRGSLDFFASPMRDSLLRNALQVAFDTKGESKSVNVNYWQPWDMGNVKMEASGALGGSGLVLDRSENKDGTIDVELMLPWSMVGNPGFAAPPAADCSLAIVLGYDSPGRSRIYRWPYGNDPWATSNIQDEDEKVFGEIRLMP